MLCIDTVSKLKGFAGGTHDDPLIDSNTCSVHVYGPHLLGDLPLAAA